LCAANDVWKCGRNRSASDSFEKFSSGKFSHRYVILSDSV
jgi:hypothetical protein